MVHGKALSVGAAHRGTNDHCRPEPKGIHERHHVCRKIASAIASRRTIRIAMAPLGHGKGMDGLGQVRQHGLEGVPRVSITMQKDHGNARGISLLDIGKLNPVRKLNRLDDGYHGCRPLSYLIVELESLGKWTVMNRPES